MKKDTMDIMLEKYEARLKDVLEYFNVEKLEDKGIAKQYWGMVKEELRVLKFFVYDIYIATRREGNLKKRQSDKYDIIVKLERTLDKCLQIHSIAKSLTA